MDLTPQLHFVHGNLVVAQKDRKKGKERDVEDKKMFAVNSNLNSNMTAQ